MSAADADILVLGFGAAGAAAAITAAELGARVIIVEKQPEDAHTPSTRMSAGSVMTVNDAAVAAPYMALCAGDSIPAEVTRAWAEEAAQILPWLRSLDADAPWTWLTNAEYPGIDGAGSIDVYRAGVIPDRLDFSDQPGLRLYGLLRAAVERAGIEVRWGDGATRLLRDADGRVTGVETASGTVLTAAKGVVLATGGFEFDEESKRAFLPAYPMRFYGNPGNTGDGLRMAQQVGASLWHMNQIVGRGIGSFTSSDGGERNFMLRFSPGGYVVVDSHGERFTDESGQAMLTHALYYDLIKFDAGAGEYPRVPSYWIFDEKRRRAGALVPRGAGLVAIGAYDWSEDNEREIAEGWIHRADTVEEAARLAGVADPAAVAASVEAYNAGCASGEDRFGRPAATLIPLDEGPYYCVPMWPGGSNTSGGPRRDADARVISTDGAPIEGLYCAGELGQVIGLRYPADGANLSEALCFGRRAARHALA